MLRYLLMVVLALIPSFAFAQGAKDFPDPTPRRAEILKLFRGEFIEITPGQGKYPAKFSMGSKTAASEQPVHEVSLKSPFHIAKYEVTQELYQVVMGTNPSKWKGPRNSAEMMDWNQAVEFCKKATEMLREAKLIEANEIVRLPSEAEWEYVCRAGTETAYSFGDDVKDLTDYGWYKVNAPGNDPPVGRKKANPWGLYDIHGYCWEWCQDDWHADYKGALSPTAARAIADTAKKVIRSGSWADEADASRSSARRGRRDRSEKRRHRHAVRVEQDAVDAIPTLHRLLYAKGVAANSPGLATGGSLPGHAVHLPQYPERVPATGSLQWLEPLQNGFHSSENCCGFNPFGVVRFSFMLPRVGSLRSPTLGC
ncbi:MAG: formylglycine-generating enzyme family protein [Gemmataceae bacterium]